MKLGVIRTKYVNILEIVCPNFDLLGILRDMISRASLFQAVEEMDVNFSQSYGNS